MATKKKAEAKVVKKDTSKKEKKPVRSKEAEQKAYEFSIS